LTQFNCLTLNLGLRGAATIEQLLEEYTEPEDVEGVECERCTKTACGKTDAEDLQSVNPAEAEEDLKKKMPAVLRTKAKQITIGRLPKDLVLHINRSIFDDYGNQRKNSSPVTFPMRLEFLSRWCAPLDETGDHIEAIYELKCLVTHYGRHDNGHYVALGKRDKDWYSFNDEIVTKISEQEVLSRGNGFMLFYEATGTHPNISSSLEAASPAAEFCDVDQGDAQQSEEQEAQITEERTIPGATPVALQPVKHDEDSIFTEEVSSSDDSSTASLQDDGHADASKDIPAQVPIMRTATFVSSDQAKEHSAHIPIVNAL
jgi:ubiquitin carboxyl-terminal hydrolase 1